MSEVRSQHMYSNMHQHASAITPIHFNEPVRTNLMIQRKNNLEAHS